jgi:hypothetical protein
LGTSVTSEFIAAIPRQLAQVGLRPGRSFPSARTEPEAYSAELELKRGLMLADSAVRVWSRRAVAHQRGSAAWIDQVPEIDTPTAARQAQEVLRRRPEVLGGWARHAVYHAHAVVQSAGRISPGLPDRAIADGLGEVAERAAACLAAMAAETDDVEGAAALARQTVALMLAFESSPRD